MRDKLTSLAQTGCIYVVLKDEEIEALVDK